MPPRNPKPRSGRSRAGSRAGKTPLIKPDLLKKIPWSKLYEFFCMGLIGFVAAVILSLSCIPWWELAGGMVEGKSLIFVAMLSKLPFVGGLFSLIPHSPVVVGVSLFVFFNVCQVSLFLIASNNRIMNSDKAWRVTVLSGIGYLCEGYVALLTYPPYQGGAGAFWSDLMSLQVDPYYIDYGALGAFLLQMFAFEVFLWMGVTLIMAARQNHKKQRRA